MHRILALLTLAVAATAVAGTLAMSQPNASAHHGAVPAASSVCPDPAHCPFGSCAVGSSQSAALAPAGRAERGGSCSTPAACGQACPRGDAATSVAVAGK